MINTLSINDKQGDNAKLSIDHHEDQEHKDKIEHKPEDSVVKLN